MPIPIATCHAALLASIVAGAISVAGQTPACRPIASHPLSDAEKAYSDGYYAQAQQLFAQALQQDPHDASLVARNIAALLRIDKVGEAAQQLSAALAANPSSAAILTAQAELQIRQGQPWLAQKSLDAAATADPCYARIHLIRSRLFRIESMYASERAELQKAYELDVTDPDILMAWSHIIPAAQEVEGTVKALDSPNNIDAETRGKAESTVHAMLPLLREDSQTCKVVPTVASASLPLLPSREDGKHIDGFRLEVKFPIGAAKLQLDTGASGLFISKSIADLNGFARGMGAPIDTVQADTVQIGPLEFHDCMVGVSDLPFPGNSDGFIGTDILASYLITIDTRSQKLLLDPLPPQTGVLPGDRAISGELAGYQPVYRRRQYMLVPVTLDNKVEKLFALDTGMRMSAMSSELAHAASDTKVNFTNSLQTKSGQPVQVYRDNFDFQFAGMSMDRQGRILSLEPSAIDHNAGFDVGGMLGFDILGQLITHLDYRDGLVKFETLESSASNAKSRGSEKGSREAAAQECPSYASAEIPLNQTLQLKVMGTLDSTHLKIGKEIWAKVVNGLIYPGCTLNRDSIVYGHVTAMSSTKSPGTAELGLSFDHADCEGKAKTAMAFHLVALLPPPDQAPSLHAALPTEVAGAMQISQTAAASNGYDALLSEGGTPNTVRPGVVVGMPGTKLEPLGGPACSSRITSSGRSVQLGTGAELILALSSSSQTASH